MVEKWGEDEHCCWVLTAVWLLTSKTGLFKYLFSRCVVLDDCPIAGYSLSSTCVPFVCVESVLLLPKKAAHHQMSLLLKSLLRRMLIVIFFSHYRVCVYCRWRKWRQKTKTNMQMMMRSRRSEKSSNKEEWRVKRNGEDWESHHDRKQDGRVRGESGAQKAYV